jgi:putative membrane protein
MEFIKVICTGIVLGAIIVLPGISAGTMAVVLNVYDRLISIITPNIKKIIVAWKFWLPLAVGIIAGVFFISRTVTMLYENYSFPTIWFFIGVIAGSVPLVYNRVREPSSLRPSLLSVICAVLALAVMIVMAILRPDEGAAIYTELTLPLVGMLAFAGVLTAMAMIIPGISGAFLLLVTGLYLTVLQAVSDLNILLLMPFVFGVGVGLFAGAALVRFLLSKAPRETYGAVLGLVTGSVIVLYPGGFGEGAVIIFSIISLLAGGIISFFLGKRHLYKTK